MKARTLMLAVTLWFVGSALCFAEDLQMGNWKLNEAKSHIPAGFAKYTTVTYEVAGDSVKVTLDGTGRDGKPVHSEWTGKFDGKAYSVTGDPNTDMRSYKKVDEHTMTTAAAKDGKATVSGRIVVSADGKTRTVNASGTDSSGKKAKSLAVYDKQ